MKHEINPDETTRATSFSLWMKSSMPMVTVVKSLEVTNLCRVSKRNGMKFNMLLSWRIGMAASKVDEFLTGHAGTFLENLQKEIDELK